MIECVTRRGKKCRCTAKWVLVFFMYRNEQHNKLDYRINSMQAAYCLFCINMPMLTWCTHASIHTMYIIVWMHRLILDTCETSYHYSSSIESVLFSSPMIRLMFFRPISDWLYLQIQLVCWMRTLTIHFFFGASYIVCNCCNSMPNGSC